MFPEYSLSQSGGLPDSSCLRYLTEEDVHDGHPNGDNRPGAKQRHDREEEKVGCIGPERFVTMKFGAESPEQARHARLGFAFRGVRN